MSLSLLAASFMALAFAGDSFQLVEQVSLNHLEGTCREAAMAFSEVSGLSVEISASTIVVVETDAGQLALLIHRDSIGNLVVDWASDPDGALTYAFRTSGSASAFSATEEVESSWAVQSVRLEGRAISDGVELAGDFVVASDGGNHRWTLARSARYGQCWVFS